VVFHSAVILAVEPSFIASEDIESSGTVGEDVEGFGAVGAAGL
jgi:hypothetical protein